MVSSSPPDLVHDFVRPRPLHEQVAERLLRNIVDGDLASSGPLPSERELMLHLGVGRSALREGLRVLDSKGIVGVRHGRGMWVRPPDEWHHLDPLVLGERVRSGQRDAAAQVLETHASVHKLVLSLAAARRTSERLEELERALGELELTGEEEDTRTFVTRHLAFHDAVAATAGNMVLASVLRAITIALNDSYERVFGGARGAVRRARAVASHRRLLAAIGAGCEAATARAARRHDREFEVAVTSGGNPARGG